MTLKSETIPIIVNEKVIVPAFTSIGKIEPFSKRISFAKGVKVVKALLILSASQTYLSGASVTCYMNGQKAGRLDWHAVENSLKSSTFDVASLLYDGTNQFELSYNLAYGTLPEQTSLVNAKLELVLDTPLKGEEAVEVGKTTETDVLAEWGQRAREIGGYVVAVSVAIAFVVGGGYVLLKRYS